MRIVKELVGKEVLGNDIMSMGKVVDVEVDLEDNFIESIIVSKGGIQESLNISKSELVIPFDMISKIGDKIILKDIFNEDLAQMEEEIETQGLEEFVQSLTETKLAQNRSEGKAKLKRENLTPRQLKQLKELGWEDLIEG